MHRAPGHGLPVSNGYSGMDGRLTVWCGRCQGSFEPDRAWAERYLTSYAQRVRGMIKPGPYGITRDQADELISDQRGQLAGLLS